MSTNEAPAPPNYTPIAQADEHAADMANKISQEQLDWAKQTYADNKDLTGQVVSSLVQAQNQNNANAVADRARYQGEFQPLEDQLVKDAQSYASPERKDLEMGRAQAGVAQQFDAARTNAQRDLEAYGINPSATRYAALDIGARAQQAAATAAAGNQASESVDATSRALRDDAINVGRGYPGQVATEYGTANNAGNSAVGDTLNTTASGANTMGTGIAWNGQAQNALNSWGNTLTQGYNAQLGQFNANQQASSGVGSALGLLAGGALGIAGLGTGGGSTIGAKLLGFADGGAVPVETDGGAIPAEVSPSGGKAVDDVPARVSVGEFILPKDVTRWYGEEKLHKMIVKAREDKQQMIQESGAIPDVHPMIAAAAQRNRQAVGA